MSAALRYLAERQSGIVGWICYLLDVHCSVCPYIVDDGTDGWWVSSISRTTSFNELPTEVVLP